MFVRVRKSKKRLRLSLVETRRDGGKVRQEHVASLGSIAAAMTLADRAEFWEKLAGRLATLSNRVTEAEAKTLIGAVVPPPTKQEIDLDNFREYMRHWQLVADFFTPHEYKPTPPFFPICGCGQAALQRDLARCAALHARSRAIIEELAALASHRA